MVDIKCSVTAMSNFGRLGAKLSVGMREVSSPRCVWEQNKGLKGSRQLLKCRGPIGIIDNPASTLPSVLRLSSPVSSGLQSLPL